LGRVFEVPEAIARNLTTIAEPPSMFTSAPASVLLHLGRQYATTPASLSDVREAASSDPVPLVRDWQNQGVNARQEEKAARSDDAEIPIHLWDEKFWASTSFVQDKLIVFTQRHNTVGFKRKYNCKSACPLVVLRHFAHSRWIRNVFVDLIQYAREHHGPLWQTQLRDTVFLETARDAIHRVSRSSFWEWHDGSTLIFWRWPKEHIHSALYGYPSWVVGELPRYRVPQRREKTDSLADKVASKLNTIRDRRYVCKGRVESLTGYFSVPKGESDIRLVYDATKSGLNSRLWSPSFHLPTMDSLVRAMDSESWMGDLDLGEMFHNFPLDVELRPYCGIDMSPYFMEARSWERWVKLMMGLRPSPYCSIKGFQLALESVLGDHTNPENVFHWSEIILNLPGQSSYDPTRPRVWKYNATTGKMAASLLSYVDDLRALGCTEHQCWTVLHHVASKLSALGIQVAARKTRPPSTTPGPWAGAVAWASAAGVSVRSTREKWMRAKNVVKSLQEGLDEHQANPDSEGLDISVLERHRGFLVHMQQVYPSLTPYLKGLHLTIDSWRDNRDAEGWKIPGAVSAYPEGYWDESLEHEPSQTLRPRYVLPVPRYSSDLQALQSLLAPCDPPLRFVRQNRIHAAFYGFVDASAGGFGSSFTTPRGIHYTYGVWGKDQQHASSNYRELNNLVTSIETMTSDGTLAGGEVYIFTDNFTAESAFYKGNTSTKALFELVLRLRTVEMLGLIQLHVIHVAGTRMMSQGTDGLSRGCLTEGVMMGSPMLSFIPLHLSAIERQPSLLPWIQDWTG
jgi:hypothetical protein